VKDAAGRVFQEGKIGSTRRELDEWIRMMPQPRTIAMEATIFTEWIYDHLLPHAEKVKVAHPLMLRAVAAAKKKNDRIDAGKIADCLRCDFLPGCHMATTEIRNRRRTLRYRSLVIKQMVQIKNRVSGLLMETGVSYNKQRLLRTLAVQGRSVRAPLTGIVLTVEMTGLRSPTEMRKLPKQEIGQQDGKCAPVTQTSRIATRLCRITLGPKESPYQS
jgi:transposase